MCIIDTTPNDHNQHATHYQATVRAWLCTLNTRSSSPNRDPCVAISQQTMHFTSPCRVKVRILFWAVFSAISILICNIGVRLHFTLFKQKNESSNIECSVVKSSHNYSPCNKYLCIETSFMATIFSLLLL